MLYQLFFLHILLLPQLLEIWSKST